MGFGSFLGRAASLVTRSPVAKVAGLVPGLGTVVNALSLAGTAYGAYKGISSMVGSGGSPQLPALPGPAGGGMAAMPSTMGQRSIFRNDPNVIEQLKPWAISMHNLKQYYRAPKGFVIRHDQNGDPFGIPKKLAKDYLGWKPAKKPLLSIRDTNAIRHAGRAIKKLQHAEKMAKKIANWHSSGHSRRKAPVMIEVKGKKVA